MEWISNSTEMRGVLSGGCSMRKGTRGSLRDARRAGRRRASVWRRSISSRITGSTGRTIIRGLRCTATSAATGQSLVVGRWQARSVNDQRLAVPSAGLAEDWSGLASLSRSGFGRRPTDSQVGGPAVGKDLPGASVLSHQDNQIFSALFAALAHGDGHEHFATTEIESYIPEHFDAQGFHLHVTQSGFEERDEKFPDRRQTANRRNAGTDERGVGGVEFDQIVDVPGVPGLSPALDNLSGPALAPAPTPHTPRTGSTTSRRSGVGLGRGRRGWRSTSWGTRVLAMVRSLV